MSPLWHNLLPAGLLTLVRSGASHASARRTPT